MRGTAALFAGESRARASAFSPEGLHRRYAPKISRHIAAVLGVDDEHEDLVQEVLMIVLRRIETLRDPACLDGWVAQVTANAIKCTMRRRRLRRHESWEGLPDRQMPSFQTDLDGRDLATRVLEVIDRLPFSERALLTCYWFTPATLERIAAEAGCSLITVRRRMLKARARFEKLARRDPALLSFIGSAGLWSRHSGQPTQRAEDHPA
jgi:RNA polymerase sigma-70 factor, ECF subfamily